MIDDNKEEFVFCIEEGKGKVQGWPEVRSLREKLIHLNS